MMCEKECMISYVCTNICYCHSFTQQRFQYYSLFDESLSFQK